MAISESPFKFFVVDAFTSSPLKGNPAVVFLLDKEKDINCLQAMAQEFNMITCYLTEVSNEQDVSKVPTYNLRWFIPASEVVMCGHGTLASAHVLISSGIVKGSEVEFVTKSGNFLAKKILLENQNGDTTSLSKNEHKKKFLIQLSFPLHPTVQLEPSEIKFLPKSLTTSSTINTCKVVTARGRDLIVELESSKDVIEFNPIKEDIENWPGHLVAITGIAPPLSGFDFFSRVFAPNVGFLEDHVCGSIHCALAPYWSKKLAKTDLTAYMASERGGTVKLHVEEETQSVLISGEAVTVMEGLFVA